MIVFCHTDLSLYCLNALQQLPGNFKDNSLFSAVCCNGAIDLFHMFQKDDIKTYLKETWEHLFPIHIMSVFHNHEILRELIQLGVDVNQRTAYGKTAFGLAARNITEESKENNINISMNTRRYQTLQLLLKHGADINLELVLSLQLVKMDMILLYDFYLIMEPTSIYVLNLEIVLYLQLVKLDMIALYKFY